MCGGKTIDGETGLGFPILIGSEKADKGEAALQEASGWTPDPPKKGVL